MARTNKTTKMRRLSRRGIYPEINMYELNGMGRVRIQRVDTLICGSRDIENIYIKLEGSRPNCVKKDLIVFHELAKRRVRFEEAEVGNW
jgi:hypothetical protein